MMLGTPRSISCLWKSFPPHPRSPQPPHNRHPPRGPHSIFTFAMQTLAAVTAATAAADRPPDRYVVRPAGVLADLLGAAELGEDELLLRLGSLG